MHYQTHEEWTLSRMGLGCYALSEAYGRVDTQAFEKTIHQAFEQGVNFFDTAEGYGGAEALLGKVIAPMRERVYIATKLSGESGAPDLSSGAVRQACEASLRRLQTDVIDLYQIHFDDPSTPVLETIEALESLVRAGKIRRYGVCHLSVERVQEYAELGDPFSILMELSPVARTAAQTLLPICQAHNLAALTFSVTGRGILAGRYSTDHVFEADDIRRMDPLFKRDRYTSAQRVRAYLAKMGEDYGATPVQMGIAWVLAQPSVVCGLTGTSSPAHLAENLAASKIEFDPGDLAELERFMADEDARLAAAQTETIRALLREPLPDYPETAFIDLVYVLETAVTLGMARETEVMPIFFELFALRKALNEDARRKMLGIQHLLRGTLRED